MNRTLVCAVLLSIVTVLSISSRCHAETYVEIEHDWTIRSFTGSYGLQGIGSSTYVCWGPSHVRIPMDLYALIALLVVGTLAFFVLSWLSVGVYLRRRAREQS